MSDIVNEAIGSIYDKGDPEMAELGRRLQKVATKVKDEERSNMIAITGAEMINFDGDENKLLDKLMANGISPKQYEIWKDKAKDLPPFSGDDVPDPEPNPDDVEEGSIKLMHKRSKEGKSHEEIGKELNMSPDEVKQAMSKTTESGLMADAGREKHGDEYMKKAAQAGREGASQEELGRLKDKYSKAEKKKK